MERGNIQSAIDEIGKVCGHTTTDPAELLLYSFDSAKIKHKPDCVVFPESTEEVSEIVKICARRRIPVTARGAGTGCIGGAVPVEGGAALVLTKMNRIIAFNPDGLYVEVEPGIVNAELSGFLEKRGFFYPPDPASLKSSTIGGNVATGAGGPSAVKYGVTGDYVMGLTVVLADGSVLDTGIKTDKGVVGYDLKKLFVGSEGTLGIITKIRLKILPKPEAVVTATAVFPERKDAVSAVIAILHKGIRPRTLEYIDRTAIRCVEGYLKAGLPVNAGAILLMETDGKTADAEKEMDDIREVCLAGGAESLIIAENREEAEAQWKTRRSISASLNRLRPTKINEDVTVPRNRIAELMERTAEMSERTGLPIVNFGHAGDGNIHVNVMTDANDAEEYELALKTVGEILDLTLALDGTLSGEHGIGITKKPYIAREIGATGVKISKAIKKALDPDNILNPGKIFP